MKPGGHGIDQTYMYMYTYIYICEQSFILNKMQKERNVDKEDA